MHLIQLCAASCQALQLYMKALHALSGPLSGSMMNKHIFFSFVVVVMWTWQFTVLLFRGNCLWGFLDLMGPFFLLWTSDAFCGGDSAAAYSVHSLLTSVVLRIHSSPGVEMR
jgi:hypothetical protein